MRRRSRTSCSRYLASACTVGEVALLAISSVAVAKSYCMMRSSAPPLCECVPAMSAQVLHGLLVKGRGVQYGRGSTHEKTYLFFAENAMLKMLAYIPLISTLSPPTHWHRVITHQGALHRTTRLALILPVEIPNLYLEIYAG